MKIFFLLWNTFAWGPLKGKKKETQKEENNYLGEKNALIIQARIIRITSNVNIFGILEYLKCFSQHVLYFGKNTGLKLSIHGKFPNKEIQQILMQLLVLWKPLIWWYMKMSAQ